MARVSTGVAVVADQAVAGFVRMLTPPSCSRCIILAGATYRWNAGFQRHPRCDCVHIPATEDVLGDGRTDPKVYFAGLTEAQQDKVFTIAGARAIRDGADIGRVVNARRGANGLTPAGGRLTEAEATAARGGRRQRGRLARTSVGGRDVYTTTVRAAGRGGKRVRLMPESIYEIAGDDRAEALRLLRVHGYLIGG